MFMKSHMVQKLFAVSFSVVSLSGCVELGQIQSVVDYWNSDSLNSGHIIECTTKMSYTFSMPSVTTLSTDFSTTTASGSAVISDTSCEGVSSGDTVAMLADNKIARSGNSLKFNTGAADVDTLEIDGTDLQAKMSTGCENGKVIVYDYNGGQLDLTGKKVSIDLSISRTATACGSNKSGVFKLLSSLI